MEECFIDVHNVWGPQVQGCGTDFDLTLLFQEIILSIWPLAIAICWALWRILQLHIKDSIVASSMLYGAKAVSVINSLRLALQLLTRWTTADRSATSHQSTSRSRSSPSKPSYEPPAPTRQSQQAALGLSAP